MADFNLSFVPKLQTMALVKIAGAMWNHYEIRNEMKSLSPLSLCINPLDWKNISDKVKINTKLLPLPDYLQKKTSSIIMPLGLLIKRWIKNYCIDQSSSDDFPDEFVWTSQGTIDSVETAAIMLRDDSVSVISRFKLACLCCVEDEIFRLWNRFPENLKLSFLREDDILEYNVDPLVVYWVYYIKNELFELVILIGRLYNRVYAPAEYAFEMAALTSNIVGTKFFIQKLPIEKKEDIIVRTANLLITTSSFTYGYGDILLVLFQNMKNDKVIEVLQRGPLNVLFCFLEWPWQSLLLKIVSLLDKSNQIKYHALLVRAIKDKINQGYSDYDYDFLYGKLNN